MKRPPTACDSINFYQQNLYKMLQDLKEVLPGPIPDVILNQKCLIHKSPSLDGDGDKNIQSNWNKFETKVANRVFIGVGR